MLRRTLIVGLAALSLGFAACGDDDDDDSPAVGTDTPAATTPAAEPEPAPDAGGAGADLTITAEPSGQLAYTEDAITTAAGPGKLLFVNEASVPHDVIIENDGGEVAKTEVITEDEETVDIDLAAGEYTYFCSVPGHRGAGMEGTLTAE